MSDYELGLRLRRQILEDLQRNRASDGRRLQALLSDFCGDRQAVLLPALRHLVQSAGFSRALQEQPPLAANPQLLLHLQQDLRQVFANSICERTDVVLQGLLELPASPQDTSATANIPTSSTVSPVESGAPPPPSGQAGLIALLSFIAGVLVVGVGGGLAWLWLQGPKPPGEVSPALAPATNSATSDSTAQTQQPVAKAPTPPPLPPQSMPERSAMQQAVVSVQELYNQLTLGNMAAARQLFSGPAADQFDPAFFRQFQRVSVDNLVETARQGDQITLQGDVTFVYPDGSTQRESRNFTVDTASEPPQITASSFGQVLQSRQTSSNP